MLYFQTKKTKVVQKLHENVVKSKESNVEDADFGIIYFFQLLSKNKT